MKKIPIIVFICTFILCSVNMLQAQDKIKLEYDFEVGTKLNYSMRINGDVSIEVNPDSINPAPKNTAKMVGDFTYTHEITDKDVKAKTAKLNIIYGKSEMYTIVNGQKIPNNDVPLLEGKVAVITGSVPDGRNITQQL